MYVLTYCENSELTLAVETVIDPELRVAITIFTLFPLKKWLIGGRNLDIVW